MGSSATVIIGYDHQYLQWNWNVKTARMKNYSKRELEEARVTIISIISKCEKVLEKFSDTTPQRTLLLRRINALVLSRELIDNALENHIGSPDDENINC